METGKFQLTDGAWDRRRAFIVGGGPSLKSFDWNHLAREERVLVVNMAFKEVPNAAVFFTEDYRVIELVHRRPEWKAFKGHKVFHALDKSYIAPMLKLDPSLFVIERKRPDKFWARSMPDGLSYSSNSMIGALNLVDILGADPICILGLDCNRNSIGGRENNYHREYENAGFDRTGDFQYETFASDFRLWAAPHLKHRSILNLNRDSDVNCWPKFDGTYNEYFADQDKPKTFTQVSEFHAPYIRGTK